MRALFDSGKRGEAVALAQRLHKDEPRDSNVMMALADLLTETGRHREALEVLEANNAPGFTRDPGHLRRLGTGLLNEDRHREAASVLQEATELDPKNPRGHNNLGQALYALGDMQGAAASYATALRFDPHHAGALCNLGRTLLRLERAEEAVSVLRLAITVAPRLVAAHVNLAQALAERGEYADALSCYDRALLVDRSIEPVWLAKAALELRTGASRAALESLCQLPATVQASSAALVLKGRALRMAGNDEQAMTCFEGAAVASPNDAQTLAQLGLIHAARGRFSEAKQHLERAFALDPTTPYLEGHLLAARLNCADWVDYDESVASLLRRISADEPACSPFLSLHFCSSAATQRHCAEIYARDFHVSGVHPQTRRYAADRRLLTVGYLSADLYAHATAYLMIGVFERHNPDKTRALALSIGPHHDNSMRDRIATAFDGIENLHAMSDEGAARRIETLNVDVLVDLKGYTSSARPGILARRPAPIQISYLGYPGTMGAGFIDYLIADAELIPEEARAGYSEKIIYLPNCYQPNEAAHPLASPATPRERHGLPSSGFVFCSFNNVQKITPEVFAAWMRVLGQVNNSVLWLLIANADAEFNLRRCAERAGIDPSRIVCARPVEHEQHLARYQAADLFLDTVPYNAHTTGSDALRAGCPLLTVTGSTFAGRVGLSLSHAIGLPEMACLSLAEYERRAIELASDRASYRRLKRHLEENMPRSPLFDTDARAWEIEQALVMAWERHQQGLPPESFNVPNRSV